ncbi:HAD hydrolase family protein [Actinomycetaceae bacterium MB13-C1-2]|nr:HAD hydrolase family protein [Actinomycetaceae bacterium MB13-C1-2]
MSNPLLVPPPHKGPRIPYQDILDHARSSLPGHLPKKPQEILVALDVDGTLLTAEGATERMKRTVQDALDAGVNIVIATGRGISSTRPVFAALELPDGYSVSSNGAQTVHWTRETAGGSDPVSHTPELMIEHVFDPRPSADVIFEAVPEILIGVDDGAEGMLVSRKFPFGEMMSEQIVRPIGQMLSRPTARMIARAPWMDRDDFEKLLWDLPLADVQVAVGWTAWADICPGGITKATGLQELADSLGVNHEGTIALGDGVNDIEMLQWAGHGVAMGGASDVVVASANAQTGPVDFDGAAAVLEAVLETL